jgi:hypothetical protein
MAGAACAQGDQDEDGSKLAFQPAARFAPVMDQVYSELIARCAVCRASILRSGCAASLLNSLDVVHATRMGMLAHESWEKPD